MLYMIGTLAYLWAFWMIYILVMGLYRAYLDKRLSKLMIVLVSPVLLLGLLFDVLANVTVATILFWEFPKEALVTTRLSRYIKTDTTWRRRHSKWVCTKLLDPFDPSNNHCGQ